MTKSIKIIFFAVAGFLISLPVYAALQIKDYPDWLPLDSGMSLADLIAAIFNVFLVLAGLVAFIMIVVGGIRYIVSIGNPSATADARSQIFSALLGLVLLFSSFVILNMIDPVLVALTDPEMQKLAELAYAEPGQIKVKITQPEFAPPNDEWALNIGGDAGTKSLNSGISLVIDPKAGEVKITGATLASDGTTQWKAELKDLSLHKEFIKGGTKHLIDLVIDVGPSLAQANGLTAFFTSSSGGETYSDLIFEDKLRKKTTKAIKNAKGKRVASLEIDPKTNKAVLLDLDRGKELAKSDLVNDAKLTGTTIGKVQLIVQIKIGIEGYCKVGELYAVQLFKERGFEDGDGGNEPLRCFKAGSEKRWRAATEDIMSLFFASAATGAGAVKVYEKANFQGRQICFNAAHRDIKNCIIRDEIFDDKWENDFGSLKVLDPNQLDAECPAFGRTLDESGQPTAKNNEKCS